MKKNKTQKEAYKDITDEKFISQSLMESEVSYRMAKIDCEQAKLILRLKGINNMEKRAYMDVYNAKKYYALNVCEFSKRSISSANHRLLDAIESKRILLKQINLFVKNPILFLEIKNAKEIIKKPKIKP